MRYSHISESHSTEIGDSVRCDYIGESLGKDLDLFKKAYRKNFSKKDESQELQGEDITRYGSVVGRLMYTGKTRCPIQHSELGSLNGQNKKASLAECLARMLIPSGH